VLVSFMVADFFSYKNFSFFRTGGSGGAGGVGNADFGGSGKKCF